MTELRRRIVLSAYPEAGIAEETFAVREEPIPPLREGEALLANIYATVDPAQSRRLRPYANYVPPFALGDMIEGLSLGRVVASRSPFFRDGDYYTHWSGWETHSILQTPARYEPADRVLMQHADPAKAPLADYLGPLGGKGITAWIATKLLGDVKDGDRVLVSAAAGAVGGIAGQLARAYGAGRVVGIASGKAKADYLTDDLSFDAVVDRSVEEMPAGIERALPEGVDVYVDNVGGSLQAEVMERMRMFGRFVITGTVSEYGFDEPPPGPNLFVTVRRTFSIHGFLATHYYPRFLEFHEEMLEHLADGRVKSRFDVVAGLENAGSAMDGMLKGANIGQRLLQIADDPTAGNA